MYNIVASSLCPESFVYFFLQVMEHPHTLLLGKVLQSNIALGNAHVNNVERSRIINRWMELQQSINVLFDSKTATSELFSLVFRFYGCSCP